MRVLLDANVLVAAFVSRGSCYELVEHCVSQRHQILSSERILEEARKAFRKKAGLTAEEAEAFIREIRARVVLQTPALLPEDACRDPKDAHVLGAALAGQCDCLVTGDKDLLTLGKFRGIPILSPREFWRFEAEFGS